MQSEYQTMEPRPLRSIPAKTFIGLSGLALLATGLHRLGRVTLHLFASQSSSHGEPFVPKDGVDKVLLRPAIPSQFQLMPPSIFGPEALFVYSALFLDDVAFMKGAATSEEGWVYGAHVSPGQDADMAIFTGRPTDIVKGRLLTFSTLLEDKMDRADELMEYNPQNCEKLGLKKHIVRVVRKDGSALKAYMYYQVAKSAANSVRSMGQPVDPEARASDFVRSQRTAIKERWDEAALKKVAEQMWTWRGQELPSWAEVPGAGQESVWLYPRPPAILPEQERVQVFLNGALIADTHKAVKILETAHPPTYYIPLEDIKTEYFLPVPGRSSWCEWKGTAQYYSLKDGRGVIAWSYLQPHSSLYQGISAHMAIYIDREGVTGQVGGIKARAQGGGYYGGWVLPGVHVGPFKGDPGCPGS
eukprot:g51737.t1